jgi:hypothetical protein
VRAGKAAACAPKNIIGLKRHNEAFAIKPQRNRQVLSAFAITSAD